MTSGSSKNKEKWDKEKSEGLELFLHMNRLFFNNVQKCKWLANSLILLVIVLLARAVQYANCISAVG